MNNSKGRTGHLYAVAFSTGVVKVGQSQEVDRRIARHVATAAIHNATPDRIWVSNRVDRLDERERDLLTFCRERWKPVNGGEYFRHADIAKIIEWANRTGAATREVRGRPVPASDMEGSSFVRAFQGTPAEAPEVRAWTRLRVPHEDAPQVANELFTAILGSGADVVEMTLSTAGARLRIAAVGPNPLPLRASHGPGWRIVAGLSRATGVTPDERGLWALLAPADIEVTS